MKHDNGLESLDDKIDWSQVKDMYDENEIFEEMKTQGFAEEEEIAPEIKKRNKKLNKKKLEMI